MLPRDDWKKIPYHNGKGKVICCIGAGPSLRKIDLSKLVGKKNSIFIVVNRVAEKLPWADFVITSDTSILKNHYDLPFFGGTKIACMYKDFGESDAIQPLTRNMKQRDDIIYIERVDESGISTRKDQIHGHANSGFGALNLAVLMQPKMIVLLGYDFNHHHSYWYDKSPLSNNSFPHYERQYRQFMTASVQIKTLGIEVINGSLISKLPFWTQVAPELLVN